MKSLLIRFCCLSLLLGISLPGKARLGETQEQTTARYGPVLASSTPPEATPGDLMVVYRKSGIEISVIFSGGVVQLESLRNIDGSDFSQEEIDTLLKAESDGQKWIEDKPSDIMRSWKRMDNAAATYLVDAKLFSFVAPKYASDIASDKPLKKGDGF